MRNEKWTEVWDGRVVEIEQFIDGDGIAHLVVRDAETGEEVGRTSNAPLE